MSPGNLIILESKG